MYPGNECLYCAEWVSSRQSYRLYEEIVPIISFPLNSFLYLSFLLFITTPNKYLFFSSLPRPTNIFSSLHYHTQQISFLLFITTPNKYLFFSSLPRPTNIFSSLHYHAQQISFLLFITTPNKYLFFSSLPRPTNIFSSLHYHA